MKRLLSTLMAVCIIALGAAANKTVKGKVVSASDQEPLIGASVQAVGSNQGTATDINGEFSLTVNDNVTQLKISYVGYVPQFVAVASNITVALEEEDNTLEEVVVTALGITRKEKSIGYAATAVKGEDLAEPAERTEEYYRTRPCIGACRTAAEIAEKYLMQQPAPAGDGK